MIFSENTVLSAEFYAKVLTVPLKYRRIKIMIKKTVKAEGSNESNSIIAEIDLPGECPICKASIGPIVLYAVTKSKLFETSKRGIVVICACPSCADYFVVSYNKNMYSDYMVDSIEPKKPKVQTFDKNLSKISTAFIEIYNQALAAETYNLYQIAGMGYRKALEFLIKDYAVYLEPTKAEGIKKSLLNTCIENYIDSPKIKATARISTWLGNDETHYIRKFIDSDINDLKKFIDTCVYWILFDYNASVASEIVDKK